MGEMKTWDMWDTLVTRLVPTPAHIFSVVALASGCTDFAKRRIEAERFARIGVEEVTIYEIYDALDYPLDLRDRLLRLELDAEIKYSAPICKNIREFRSVDLILTDMYLPRDTLEAILAKCGVPYQSENLLISAELKLSKASGRLFGYVANRFPGETFSHCGDNEYSDIRRAKAADYLVRWERSAELTQEEQTWLASDVPFTAGCVRAARLAEPPLSESLSRIWKITASRIAPAIYGFSLWILRSSLERGISKIIFLSRDGYLPNEFCKFLCANCDEFRNLQPIYAYGSRQALHLPSYDGDIASAMAWLSDESREISLQDLANRSLISVERLKRMYAAQHAIEGQISADIPISKDALSELLHLSEFRAALHESALSMRGAAMTYWESIGISRARSDERIGIVDLGWNGRMQDSVSKLLRLLGQTSELVGFYFGLSATAKTNFPSQRMVSFTEYVARGPSVWASENANLLEYLFPATHSSVLRYQLNGTGGASVEFHEGISHDADLEIRSTIISCAMNFIKHRIQLPLDINYDPLASGLRELATSPTRADALAFMDARHSDAQGDDGSTGLISGVSPLVAFFQSRKYRYGYWKEGTFALHRLMIVLKVYRWVKYFSGLTFRIARQGAR